LTSRAEHRNRAVLLLAVLYDRIRRGGEE